MKLRWKDSGDVFIVLLAALVFVCGGNGARAQTISEITPLNFGTIVIISFSAVGSVTLNPSGGYTYNSNVYLIDPPQLGEYQLSGGPPNALYTLSFPSSVPMNGGGGPFTLDNLEARPLTLMTDGAGEDTFTVSGRIQTLGGGTHYNDGAYNGVVTITMNF